MNQIERGFQAFRKEAGERIAQLERDLEVANNWVEHHQNHCDDLIKENAELRADKNAFFRHNSILVELMTEEQKKKALDVLMSRKEAHS
jgi:hypothetical protein